MKSFYVSKNLAYFSSISCASRWIGLLDVTVHGWRMEEKNLYGGGLPADARAAAYRQCDRAAQTGSETGGARTHVRRARRRNHCLASYCTGHICAQSVRARHAQAHRWVFRFPFRFFFSSLKSEYLKLTNNRFWLKYCCLIATKFFL